MRDNAISQKYLILRATTILSDIRETYLFQVSRFLDTNAKDNDTVCKYHTTDLIEFPQTYSMDCYFRQSWVDRRLAFQGGKETLALSISMLARIWKPDTYFYNGKYSYLHTITSPNKFVRLYQDGRVLYSSRYARVQTLFDNPSPYRSQACYYVEFLASAVVLPVHKNMSSR